jgi:type I restriction-modification system DNA methylase subunit
MDADDFRDYMLSFLFLRYLSDNYETAARKELGKDYPQIPTDVCKNPERRRLSKSGKKRTRQTSWLSRNKCAARYITSSSLRTSGIASPTWPAPRMASF